MSGQDENLQKPACCSGAKLDARIQELGLVDAVRAELQHVGLPAYISGRHVWEGTGPEGAGFICYIGTKDNVLDRIAQANGYNFMPGTLEIGHLGFPLESTARGNLA